MKKHQKHIKTGYNRRRNAEKRFRNSELGKLGVTKISKQTKTEVLLNVWGARCWSINMAGESRE